MEEDSHFLMTPQDRAIEITNWIASKILPADSSEKLTMIDATAGIGGDTYAFAANRKVERVFSVELDAVRFTGLVNNILALGLEQRVVPQRADFASWIKSQASTLLSDSNACVYIDAPWGGPGYKKHAVIDDLYLDGDNNMRTSLVELCRELLTEHKFKWIVLKLPFNFNFDNLTTNKRHSIVRKQLGNIIFALISVGCGAKEEIRVRREESVNFVVMNGDGNSENIEDCSIEHVLFWINPHDTEHIGMDIYRELENASIVNDLAPQNISSALPTSRAKIKITHIGKMAVKPGKKNCFKYTSGKTRRIIFTIDDQPALNNNITMTLVHGCDRLKAKLTICLKKESEEEWKLSKFPSMETDGSIVRHLKPFLEFTVSATCNGVYCDVEPKELYFASKAYNDDVVDDKICPNSAQATPDLLPYTPLSPSSENLTSDTPVTLQQHVTGARNNNNTQPQTSATPTVANVVPQVTDEESTDSNPRGTKRRKISQVQSSGINQAAMYPIMSYIPRQGPTNDVQLPSISVQDCELKIRPDSTQAPDHPTPITLRSTQPNHALFSQNTQLFFDGKIREKEYFDNYAVEWTVPPLHDVRPNYMQDLGHNPADVPIEVFTRAPNNTNSPLFTYKLDNVRNYLQEKAAIQHQPNTLTHFQNSWQQQPPSENNTNVTYNNNNSVQQRSMIAIEKMNSHRIHWSALLSGQEAVQFWLEQGEDVNVRDMYDITPLHLAVWAKNYAAVTYLLHHGANPVLPDFNFVTPLMLTRGDKKMQGLLSEHLLTYRVLFIEEVSRLIVPRLDWVSRTNLSRCSHYTRQQLRGEIPLRYWRRVSEYITDARIEETFGLVCRQFRQLVQDHKRRFKRMLSPLDTIKYWDLISYYTRLDAELGEPLSYASKLAHRPTNFLQSVINERRRVADELDAAGITIEDDEDPVMTPFQRPAPDDVALKQLLRDCILPDEPNAQLSMLELTVTLNQGTKYQYEFDWTVLHYVTAFRAVKCMTSLWTTHSEQNLIEALRHDHNSSVLYLARAEENTAAVDLILRVLRLDKEAAQTQLDYHGQYEVGQLQYNTKVLNLATELGLNVPHSVQLTIGWYAVANAEMELLEALIAHKALANNAARSDFLTEVATHMLINEEFDGYVLNVINMARHFDVKPAPIVFAVLEASGLEGEIYRVAVQPWREQYELTHDDSGLEHEWKEICTSIENERRAALDAYTMREFGDLGTESFGDMTPSWEEDLSVNEIDDDTSNQVEEEEQPAPQNRSGHQDELNKAGTVNTLDSGSDDEDSADNRREGPYPGHSKTHERAEKKPAEPPKGTLKLFNRHKWSSSGG